MSNLMYVRTMRGANIDSDHHLIKATIRAHVFNIKTTQQRKRKKLKIEAIKNQSMTQKFLEHIEQFLETNDQQTEDQTVEQKWGTCARILTTAAKETIGIQRGSNKGDWFDEECRETTRRKN